MAKTYLEMPVPVGLGGSVYYMSLIGNEIGEARVVGGFYGEDGSFSLYTTVGVFPEKSFGESLFFDKGAADEFRRIKQQRNEQEKFCGLVELLKHLGNPN